MTIISAREVSGAHVGHMVQVGVRSFLLNEVRHRAGAVTLISSTGAVYALDGGNAVGVAATSS